MKSTAQAQQQMTFEDLMAPAPFKSPASIAPPAPIAPPEPPVTPEPPVRTTSKLVGQPFISPLAKIPTNRTPLSPTFKLR